MLPGPPEAMLILPGLVFAYAMNSGTDFAGNDGFTTTTPGLRRKLATGAMSRIKSKLVFEERCVECVGRRNVQKRVAIGGCSDDRIDSDVAAGPRAVLDDKLL